MRMRMTIAIVATVTLSSTSAAQKLVGRDSIRSLPNPALLDTTWLFQGLYASVGNDLFITGQPTERALREMKELGVTNIINLRMPQEMERIGFDEPKLIAELGMKYVYIPMRGGEGEQSYSRRHSASSPRP